MKRGEKKKPLTKDEYKSKCILSNSIQVDSVDIDNTEREYAEYLHLAIENYMQTIMFEIDDFSCVILFRIFALCFANKTDSELLKKLAEGLTKIASYKFITLMPQIATRLSNVSDDFSKIIRKVVGKFWRRLKLCFRFCRDKIVQHIYEF